MPVRAFGLIAAVLLLFMPAALLHAQSGGGAAQSIELSLDQDAPKVVLTRESLAALPQIERDVSFETSKGPSSGHYKGVLFWDVLEANRAFDGLEHNAELKKTFVVTGRDGYQIAFSVGEIHPDFGDTPMMVATEVDGQPFADGLRLVVPGDRRGARNVREIVAIDLR